ncbi:MAG: L,D-transpeptidase [Proteobacteria bacterium]|nr:L,D-transpeptidase [Pseudomonadota bacterium]MCH8177658.1 L,D-transpeptidase [Pseudomonadota bacterium]
MISWWDLNRQVLGKLPGNLALADERPFILIDTKTQRLHRIDIEQEESISYRISTAVKGLGNREESYRTPFGILRIKQKIGGGEPAGRVFKGREPTGKISKRSDNREEDEITSRIMWLDGMEQGINKGQGYDTFSRYIYIHGTTDEKRIGYAVSSGCIRMKNADVIDLFEEVLVNDLVVIQ